jgi:hypothetical protein
MSYRVQAHDHKGMFLCEHADNFDSALHYVQIWARRYPDKAIVMFRVGTSKDGCDGLTDEERQTYWKTITDARDREAA